MSRDYNFIMDVDLTPALNERLAKARKLAKRFGTPEPTVTIGEPRKLRGVTAEGHGYNYMGVNVAISMETPKFNGWALCARIEHDKDVGTLVHCVPGREVPREYRDAKPVCDHCKAARRRKDTFVVQHDDGRFMRVGRQCVADFLGHQVNFYSVFRILDELDPDRYGSGLPPEPVYSFARMAVVAARLIRMDGYMSKTRANAINAAGAAQVQPTSADVAMAISITARGSKEPKLVEWAKKVVGSISREDRKTAVRARRFWKTHTGFSEFEDNCRKLAQAQAFKLKHVALVTAAVNSYLKHAGIEADRKLQRDSDANSKFQGTIGERVERDLVCSKSIPVSTDFGTLHINKLKDAAGNVFVWKTGTEALRPGTAYKLKCTVKKHDAYQGVEQTLLARCVILEERAA